MFNWMLQAASPAGDVVIMQLENWADSIEAMSAGRLKIEVLPSGAVVAPFDIHDAVSKRVVDAGQAWCHYAIGKNKAAGLFGSPPGGAGTGLDQVALLSWYYEDEGLDLYWELYQDVMNLDLVAWPFMPQGPETLGWYREPIETLEEFKKVRFRCSSGLAQDVYKEMGASPVSMGGAEVIPALERGVLDGAEWNTPANDIALAFYDVCKYYCLGGLHQAITLGEVVFSKEGYNELPPDLQAMIPVATKAAYLEAMLFNMRRNAEALDELVNVHGVIIFPAPPGYAEEFTAAVTRVMTRFSAEDPFFKKVLDSQLAYAAKVVQYQTECNELYASLGAATFR